MRTGISRPLIFVVISILVVALIYSSYSVIAYAAPSEVGWHNSENCTGSKGTYRCCWTEREPGPKLVRLRVTYCQECTWKASLPGWDCKPKEKQALPPTAGENIVPGVTGGLEQSPRPPTFDPTAPLQEGVLEQQEPPTPPTFAPGTTPGVLEQLEQQTPPPPPFVPGFLERQEQLPPADQGAAEPPTGEGEQPAVPEAEPPVTEEADQGTTAAPQPLTRTCPVGNVWDPDLMICVPDVPPIELCPDGSIPQPTGPGGIRPECPLSETAQLQAEEPGQTPAEEPEQPEAQEEPQEQLSDEGEEQPTEDNSNN